MKVKVKFRNGSSRTFEGVRFEIASSNMLLLFREEGSKCVSGSKGCVSYRFDSGLWVSFEVENDMRKSERFIQILNKRGVTGESRDFALLRFGVDLAKDAMMEKGTEISNLADNLEVEI